MADASKWPPDSGGAVPPVPFQYFSPWKNNNSVWYRVHPYDPATGRYGSCQFNDSSLGNARFSPLIDPSTGKVIPTIYAAATESGAIAEVTLHEAPTPSKGYIHDWQRDCNGIQHLSSITIAPLELVALTSLGLKGAGMKVSDFFDGNQPDYERTRAWALYIWQTMPDAQGLWWMSVRDNRCPVLMLFGDRCPPNALAQVSPPQHIRHFEADVIALLEQMQASIAP